MDHGKNICRQLKQLRRDIADQNGIELEIPECTYQGECSGTCPRCDYELRYLEGELARRQSLGKAAVVAGTVLTMASFQTANAQEPVIMGKPAQPIEKVDGQGALKGTIRFKVTDEPLIGCNVVVKQNGQIVSGATTNYDGLYTIKGLKEGIYTVEIKSIGYETVIIEDVRVKKKGFTVLNRDLEKGIEPPLIGIIPVQEKNDAGENVIHNGGPDTSRTPMIRIETDGNGEATGKYTIGGIETQLDGTPASNSGQTLPFERPMSNDNDVNPLDNKQ